MLNLFKKKAKIDTELESKIKMFLNAGIEYFKKKDFSSSKKYFERVLEINPGNVEAENYLKVVISKIALEEKKKIQQLAFEKENIEVSVPKMPVLDYRPGQNTKSSINITDAKSLGDIQDKPYYYKLLRLESNAAQDDIKETIASEFKKWRTRVNSPDIAKRYEAEEMLNILSQAKRVLLHE